MKNIKKIIILNLILLLLFSINIINSNTLNVNSSANQTTYGRINVKNGFLYKTAILNETIENKYCLLPETFFVKVISDYNDIFLKVEFDSLIGYVKKSTISLVNETPKTPYPPKLTFAIKTSTGTHLRISPKTDTSLTNIITTLDKGTKNLPYLGKIWGAESVDTQGNVWYLTLVNNQLGYVHSYYSDTFIPEQTNSEVTTPKLTMKDTNLNPITDFNNAILILISLIPLIAVLFLLYKPRKTTTPIRVTKKTKTASSQDLNFDDSDIL